MADAPVPPTTSLTAFERAVFGGDHGAALPMLFNMLEAIEQGADLPQGFSSEAETTKYFTRFAAAILGLLSEASEPFTPQAVDLLAYHNGHIAAVFRLSGYGDPGHLYSLVHGLR